MRQSNEKVRRSLQEVVNDVSTEQDPAKLNELVQELTSLLDREPREAEVDKKGTVAKW